MQISYDSVKQQIQTKGPNDWSDWAYGVCGATFLQFTAHNFISSLQLVQKKNLCRLVSCHIRALIKCI